MGVEVVWRWSKNLGAVHVENLHQQGQCFCKLCRFSLYNVQRDLVCRIWRFTCNNSRVFLELQSILSPFYPLLCRYCPIETVKIAQIFLFFDDVMYVTKMLQIVLVQTPRCCLCNRNYLYKSVLCCRVLYCSLSSFFL